MQLDLDMGINMVPSDTKDNERYCSNDHQHGEKDMTDLRQRFGLPFREAQSLRPRTRARWPIHAPYFPDMLHG